MFKCIGCDQEISWDGEGSFAYTCPCGATVLYNEDSGQIGLPISVALGMSQGRAFPHLDDLVGKSNHTSPTKETIIRQFQQAGFVWMEDCEQCQRDGTLDRALAREKYLAVVEAERLLREEGE